jgi:hypothetical protein
MDWSGVKGAAAPVVLIGLTVFAFRQGFSVKRPPEATPPDTNGGRGSGDGNSGHIS